MITRRQYKKSKPYPSMYVVINKEGEVYTGLIRGNINWSYNWSEAKPLFKESTTWLLKHNPGAELINEKEL